MNFSIITIFPNMLEPYLNDSMLARAQKKKLISVSLLNPRDFSKDKHKKVDDKPYGGGPGMVIQAEPILKAVEKVRGRKKKVKVILFSPSGKQFTNAYAKTLSKKYKNIILVAGRYVVRASGNKNIDREVIAKHNHWFTEMADSMPEPFKGNKNP